MPGLFNQVKDLYKLQKEAREMQKKMKAINVIGFSDDEDVKLTLNGTQSIEEIEISDELLNVEHKKDLVKGLRAAFADAQKKLQKEMSKGMDIDQIRNMLGS